MLAFYFLTMFTCLNCLLPSLSQSKCLRVHIWFCSSRWWFRYSRGWGWLCMASGDRTSRRPVYSIGQIRWSNSPDLTFALSFSVFRHFEQVMKLHLWFWKAHIFIMNVSSLLMHNMCYYSPVSPNNKMPNCCSCSCCNRKLWGAQWQILLYVILRLHTDCSKW